VKLEIIFVLAVARSSLCGMGKLIAKVDESFSKLTLSWFSKLLRHKMET
jgi:hypothetical protein